MPDWEEVLSRDGPAVWRTAYRLLGNPADADECFQEAFLDALKVSRRVAVLHWRGLLQRLVAARAVDRLRRNRRRGNMHYSRADARPRSTKHPGRAVLQLWDCPRSG